MNPFIEPLSERSLSLLVIDDTVDDVTEVLHIACEDPEFLRYLEGDAE